MAIEERKCVGCGDVFHGTSRAKYCSGKCKQGAYRKGKRETGFIYKLIDNNVVVYVGQSYCKRSMENRIGKHKAGGGTDKKIFSSYEFRELNGECIDEAEAKEILTLNPKYNKVIPHNDRFLSLRKAVELNEAFFHELIRSSCSTFAGMPVNKNIVEHVDIKTLENLKNNFRRIIK